jgi:hypothetical protein
LGHTLRSLHNQQEESKGKQDSKGGLFGVGAGVKGGAEGTAEGKAHLPSIPEGIAGPVCGGSGASGATADAAADLSLKAKGSYSVGSYTATSDTQATASADHAALQSQGNQQQQQADRQEKKASRMEVQQGRTEQQVDNTSQAAGRVLEGKGLQLYSKCPDWLLELK